jgi:hypothetical protein
LGQGSGTFSRARLTHFRPRILNQKSVKSPATDFVKLQDSPQTPGLIKKTTTPRPTPKTPNPQDALDELKALLSEDEWDAMQQVTSPATYFT